MPIITVSLIPASQSPELREGWLPRGALIAEECFLFLMQRSPTCLTEPLSILAEFSEDLKMME